MKQTRVRRLEEPHALTCLAHDCTERASVTVSWRTPAMPCSAFYYYCDKHNPVDAEED